MQATLRNLQALRDLALVATAAGLAAVGMASGLTCELRDAPLREAAPHGALRPKDVLSPTARTASSLATSALRSTTRSAALPSTADGC